MCYVPNCTNESIPDGWCFVAGVCAPHLKQLKDGFAAKYSDLKADPDLCHNVALAFVLMSDEAAVLALLEGLNTWLADVDPQHVRLTAGLEYWELVCWFPRVRIMPASVLSEDQFLSLIGSGCVLKDVGAGAPHGRLTHRLQWFAMMAAMTHFFNEPFVAPWTTSPLRLYCSMGSTGMVNGRDNVWGTVFDLGGSNPSSKFRAPDRLHTAILESSKLALQVNLSRKRDEDARNLAAAVEKHLLQASNMGAGPMKPWVARNTGGPLLSKLQQQFGKDKSFTFEELYQFLDTEIYKQTRTDKYPNAYLYIVHHGTPTATIEFLEKRGLPTNLPVMGKPNLGPPDAETITARIEASLKSLNLGEADALCPDGFDKRLKVKT
jgi:hypothetical protein